MPPRLPTLNIARDFSPNPGPGRKTDGARSGEEFLDTILSPRFAEARRAGVKLLIDLDGATGYASSFLETAFGGLVRRYWSEQNIVPASLHFNSKQEPYLIDEIRCFMLRYHCLKRPAAISYHQSTNFWTCYKHGRLRSYPTWVPCVCGSGFLGSASDPLTCEACYGWGGWAVCRKCENEQLSKPGCKHPRLDMDGICRACGEDCR